MKRLNYEFVDKNSFLFTPFYEFKVSKEKYQWIFLYIHNFLSDNGLLGEVSTKCRHLKLSDYWEYIEKEFKLICMNYDKDSYPKLIEFLKNNYFWDRVNHFVRITRYAEIEIQKSNDKNGYLIYINNGCCYFDKFWNAWFEAPAKFYNLNEEETEIFQDKLIAVFRRKNKEILKKLINISKKELINWLEYNGNKLDFEINYINIKPLIKTRTKICKVE
ncbi:Uncharacterised protein [Mycoplasmopsis maculosa]|uniref:Uncharacterized protein n=1 Tax=Mycoplasmopsis maculosa TaxID=114885 RepID=A0A449B598_9BACT|nr:hypothetical protein [Mycoplasmopsis maculosa]VEU75762.1 Uncharacterised protein [Mycoplasmopsis maculosa]